MTWIEQLIGDLIRKADELFGEKTGQEREAWVVERLKGYVEAQDEDFAIALVSLSKLPIPSEVVKTFVDNPFTDGIEAQVIDVMVKTAVRFVYGLEWVKKWVSRPAELSEEDQAKFDAAKAALADEKPESKSSKK